MAQVNVFREETRILSCSVQGLISKTSNELIARNSGDTLISSDHWSPEEAKCARVINSLTSSKTTAQSQTIPRPSVHTDSSLENGVFLNSHVPGTRSHRKWTKKAVIRNCALCVVFLIEDHSFFFTIARLAFNEKKRRNLEKS